MNFDTTNYIVNLLLIEIIYFLTVYNLIHLNNNKRRLEFIFLFYLLYVPPFVHSRYLLKSVTNAKHDRKIINFKLIESIRVFDVFILFIVIAFGWNFNIKRINKVFSINVKKGVLLVVKQEVWLENIDQIAQVSLGVGFRCFFIEKFVKSVQ